MDSTKGSPMAPPTTTQSVPQRIKAPLASPVSPYPRPRQTINPSTPDHHLSTSVPTSPYAGLSEKQIKDLQTVFAKTNSKIEYTRDILEMVGIDMTKENVVGLVAQWADRRPDVRTFSELTADDFNKLCKSIYDIVNINDDVLRQRVLDSIIPPHFLPMLRISRLVSSRRTEMGTRNIINLFLDVAVYVARIAFEGEDRLVIHHEWEIEPTEIPEIGVVSGPLDYITSRAAGRVNMGTRLHILLVICDTDIDDRTRRDNGHY